MFINDSAIIDRTSVFSGSSAGLFLTLNVEQYEYMQGPNSDAGVKVSSCCPHCATNHIVHEFTVCLFGMRQFICNTSAKVLELDH